MGDPVRVVDCWASGGFIAFNVIEPGVLYHREKKWPFNHGVSRRGVRAHPSGAPPRESFRY